MNLRSDIVRFQPRIFESRDRLYCPEAALTVASVDSCMDPFCLNLQAVSGRVCSAEAGNVLRRRRRPLCPNTNRCRPSPRTSTGNSRGISQELGLLRSAERQSGVGGFRWTLSGAIIPVSQIQYAPPSRSRVSALLVLSLLPGIVVVLLLR